MKDTHPFDWRSYTTGIEVLHGAIQQLDLVPLDDMELFLRNSIESTTPDSELSKKKIKAARKQLDMIDISKRYISEIRGFLEDATG